MGLVHINLNIPCCIDSVLDITTIEIGDKMAKHKRLNIFKNFTTGFKAILGMILYQMAMYVFLLLMLAVFGQELANVSAGVIVITLIFGLFLGVVLLGWIYRALWGWK